METASEVVQDDTDNKAASTLVEGATEVGSEAVLQQVIEAPAQEPLAVVPETELPPKRVRTAQPTRSILKPPPPPPKPSVATKLRDVLGSINPKFFDAQVPEPPSAWGGRLGRFVAGTTGPVAPAVPPKAESTSPSTTVPALASLAITAPAQNGKPLKRATFMLPALTIVYPISSSLPPWSDKVVEDRKQVESTHRELLRSNTGADYWTSDKLERLYEQACKGREERPKPAIRKAIKVAAPPRPAPRHLHLLMPPPPIATSSMLMPPAPSPPSSAHHFLDKPLNRHAAEALADVLSVEWGLSKFSLENGVLETDDALKPILHALLISGTLPSLGLAGNRKLKPSAWQLISLFLRRAQSLRYLDISDNQLDKRSMDYFVEAFAASSSTTPTSNDRESIAPHAPLLRDHGLAGPTAGVQTLRIDNCNLRAQTLEALAHGIRQSDVRNISLRRNRISNLGAVALAVMMRDYPDTAAHHSAAAIPLVVSSSAGGVTTRTVPDGYSGPVQVGSNAIQRSVRALDGVERLGNLLTLDLKQNDIRNGVSYIAQVLKRNRTLKVLNLAENRIDVGGLVALAEALKYNETLETLDLSGNPCCGRSLEGVAALRTAFTVNASLKRLFLSDTQLTTEGAIALAEFLPESKTLLHFDLTSNPLIETAGIMALAVGLKSNTLLRCLDLSIPPNNSELAELSQSILQSCVRNTETAAAKTKVPEAVWAPIKKSALVRQVKAADEERAERERVMEAGSPEGIARERVYTLSPDQLSDVGQEAVRDLERSYAATLHVELPAEPFAVLVETARALRERVVELIGSTTDDVALASLLELNDALTTQIDKKDTYSPPPRIMLPSEIVAAPSPPRRQPPRRHLRIPSVELTAQNFSLGDSDGESDVEEHGAQVVDLVEETSRRMVEEEGEIFRKGVKLGVVEKDHELESGEELRQEILDTPVARSPTRRVIALDDADEDEELEDAATG